MKSRDLESLERVFVAIRELHRESPDLRLGQIISNALYRKGRTSIDEYLFVCENEDLEAQIRDFAKRHAEELDDE